MKLKYYFLFFVLSLLASCNDEEGLDLHNKPIESNSIVLSPDEYISIAFDNQRVITTDVAKQLALDFGVNRVQTGGNENIVVKFHSSPRFRLFAVRRFGSRQDACEWRSLRPTMPYKWECRPLSRNNFRIPETSRIQKEESIRPDICSNQQSFS